MNLFRRASIHSCRSMHSPTRSWAHNMFSSLGHNGYGCSYLAVGVFFAGGQRHPTAYSASVSWADRFENSCSWSISLEASTRALENRRWGDLLRVPDSWLKIEGSTGGAQLGVAQ